MHTPTTALPHSNLRFHFDMEFTYDNDAASGAGQNWSMVQVFPRSN